MTTSTKTIILKTWRLTMPLATSRVFNMLVGFIGTLMIARLSHTILAASALITATQGMTFLISASFLFAIGAVVGNSFGAKRYLDVGATLQQGWLLSIIIAIPTIIFLCFIGHILIFLGQEPELAYITQSYFYIWVFAIPGFLLMIATQQFVLAVNQQRFVLFMSIVSLIVAVISAYALVYGHFGCPRLGVRGLAFAYVISNWFSLACYLLFCFSMKNFQRYQLFHWRIWQTRHLLKQLFKVGWPICVQIGSDIISFFVITLLIGLLGETALAAQQIVIQYFLLLVVPIFAVAQASTILVGQANGAKQYADIKRYGNMTLIIGLIFSAFVICAFVFFPHELISIYLSNGALANPALVKLATIILLLTGLRLFFDSALEIKIGSLRGLYDTKYPMVITLILTWIIGIPLAYFLGFVFHFGLVGITLAGIFTTCIAAVILWLRWSKRCKDFQVKKTTPKR